MFLLDQPLKADVYGDFEFTDYGTEITITRYTGPGNTVSIPEAINGHPVTNIGAFAFHDCTGLTSVTIPSTVREIMDYAFCDCENLEELNISSGLIALGQGSFQSCYSLKSIILPPGLDSIGHAAFNHCTSLASVAIPASVTSIGQSAFGYCQDLLAIGVDEENANFSSSGGALFNKEKTLLIQCPGGASGEYAIPLGIEEIGYRAFFACTFLTNITMPSGVTRIGEGAFYNCSGLTEMILASTVNSLGAGAFEACSKLTFVSIPASVITLDAWTFAGCSSLTNIIIPPGLTEIGRGAFYECIELTGISIPASVNSIGRGAFSGCSQLTLISVDAANPEFSSENGVLFNKAKTIILQCPAGMGGLYTIPSGVTGIGDSAFYECERLTSVAIPPCVTNIGDAAFYGCSKLTEVTIPLGVTRIGTQTFVGCAMTNMVIPPSVTSIGNLAFASCDFLTNVSIPPSVTMIEDEAFSGCRALTELTLPYRITHIGGWAFSGCSAITKITIPASVTHIDHCAFSDCGNLERATFVGDAPLMGLDAFDGSAADFTVYFFNGRTGFTTPTWMGYPAVAMDPAPAAVTSAASGITAESAILQGTVNPNGAATVALFEFGLTSAYGQIAHAPLWPNNGTEAVPVSASLTGLQPGQVYHYRLTATNPSGTTLGEDMTFTTHPVLTVTTLHGAVFPGGGYYSPGSIVELAATPSPGYVFSVWTGDATGSDNPLIVLMDANKTVTAHFVPDLADEDGDGLSNHDEIVTYGTDPALRDTDGDDLNDSSEVGLGHYWIIPGTFTWVQARTDAHNRRGELASFPTAARWNRAMESLGANAIDSYTGLWIGASDSTEEGIWTWVSGEPFTFSQWATSRPSVTAGNTLDYAEVSGGGGAELGKWYDRTFTLIRDGYILETGYLTNPTIGDTDGDGFDDGFETKKGFNPTLTTSTPEGMASIRMIADVIPPAVEFRFNAAKGVTYRIEASTDLTVWSVIEPAISGQGAVVIRAYETANLPQRFFRIARN